MRKIQERFLACLDDFSCPVYKDQFQRLWKDIDLGHLIYRAFLDSSAAVSTCHSCPNKYKNFCHAVRYFGVSTIFSLTSSTRTPSALMTNCTLCTFVFLSDRKEVTSKSPPVTVSINSSILSVICVSMSFVSSRMVKVPSFSSPAPS